jgi:hypothetical protein
LRYVSNLPQLQRLISALQVEHALEFFSKSGTSTQGIDKEADKFSEANYNGKTVSYAKSIGKIGEVTWKKIMDGARQAGKLKKVAIKSILFDETNECAMFSNME